MKRPAVKSGKIRLDRSEPSKNKSSSLLSRDSARSSKNPSIGGCTGLIRTTPHDSSLEIAATNDALVTNKLIDSLQLTRNTTKQLQVAKTRNSEIPNSLLSKADNSAIVSGGDIPSTISDQNTSYESQMNNGITYGHGNGIINGINGHGTHEYDAQGVGSDAQVAWLTVPSHANDTSAGAASITPRNRLRAGATQPCSPVGASSLCNQRRYPVSPGRALASELEMDGCNNSLVSQDTHCVSNSLHGNYGTPDSPDSQDSVATVPEVVHCYCTTLKGCTSSLKCNFCQRRSLTRAFDSAVCSPETMVVDPSQETVNVYPTAMEPYINYWFDGDPASNFVDGIDVNTKLINIPHNKFGTLLGLTDTLEWIPERFVSSSAACFSYIIEQISHHRHTKNEEMEVKYWIKLLLLPGVIFSRTSKAVTKKNIQ